MTKHTTREGWLLEAVKLLRPEFKKHKAKFSRVQVSCGWPRGKGSEVIGQCFAKSWTDNDTTHIFISPTQAEAVEVLAVLVHELVHAAVGCDKGHRKEFGALARALGLEGKLTATYVSEKSPLLLVLRRIARSLGKYPHAKMKIGRKALMSRGGYKSWIWLFSTTMPDYKLSMSRRVAKVYGYPVDPNGEKMVERKGK